MKDEVGNTCEAQRGGGMGGGSIWVGFRGVRRGEPGVGGGRRIVFAQIRSN